MKIYRGFLWVLAIVMFCAWTANISTPKLNDSITLSKEEVNAIVFSLGMAKEKVKKSTIINGEQASVLSDSLDKYVLPVQQFLYSKLQDTSKVKK